MECQEAKYQCDICNAQYAEKKTLKNHKTLHTGQLPKLSCENCEYQTLSRQCFYWHKKHNHVPKTYSFECKICQKLFTKVTLLNQHVRRNHQKVKDIKCKSCDKAFYHTANLIKHTNSVHLGLRKECEICHGQFSDINRHKKRVHSHTKSTEKIHCNVCGKAFSNKESLDSHVQYIHTLGTNNQCEICNKMFSRIASLKKHKKSKHNSIKQDYECPECNKQLSCRDSLMGHIRNIHEERKEVLLCVKCNYKGRKKDLEKHINAVHEGDS